MINHTTHWICPNLHREISAYNYHKDNVDQGRKMEMTCCVCVPHLNCGDDVARAGNEKTLLSIQQEAELVKEAMRKRYPELYGTAEKE